MAVTANRPKHPPGGMSIAHRIFVQVINYKLREFKVYKITSYATLTIFLNYIRAQKTEHKGETITKATPEFESVVYGLIGQPWKHGLQETVDYEKADSFLIMEIGTL